MASEDFPVLYRNAGLDSMDDPLLSGATLGNIFQTSTYDFLHPSNASAGNEPFSLPSSWSNVTVPETSSGPVGGSIFGPAGGGYSYDIEGWNPDVASGVGGTGYTAGGLQVGGQGITALPAVTTSTSRSWLPTIGAGLAAGGLPGVIGAVGGRLLGGALGIGSGGTASEPATVMPRVEVPIGKRYDEAGNEIFPFDVPNPLISGLQMGPNLPAGGVTQMPTYTVTEDRLAQEAEARRRIAQQQALARLDAYIGRQIDTGVVGMEAFNVNEPPIGGGGGSGGGGSIGGGGGGSIGGGGGGSGGGGSGGGGSGGNGSSGGGAGGGGAGGGGSGAGGGGGGTGGGTSTYTAPTISSPMGRNYYNEGRQSLTDLNTLMPGITALYGRTAQDLATADTNRLRGAVGDMASINQNLTGLAAAQTAAANSALRAGNIADAQRYGQQALELRKAANPELYAGLNQYQQAAQGQVTGDLARLQQAQARQLSPEDLRNAQQAAREAYSARGLVMGKGAIGAEILNRDALARQREQEARANLGTSMGQLYQGIGAQTANVFDPMAAVLGSQYGMQTQNVGLNQALFNQSAGLASGAYGNQYAQQMTNPFNPYAQDVYNTNFNAAAAKDIAAMNNAAAIEASRQSASATTGAANTALWANLIGSGVRGFGAGIFGGG